MEADEADITSDDVEPMSYGAFFIGISPIMRKLRAQAALLAEANVPVLILGESGSGKETTARLIHKLSAPFRIRVRKGELCGATQRSAGEGTIRVPKGTATAHQGFKSGKLELCAKGTILLDEITEMPLGVQANLLQVLQNKRFMRPGTSTPVEVDVRVLAASTSNMEHAVSEKRLREDLYYLLSAYTIHVPPLRERKEELPLLSRHFMHQLAKHYGLVSTRLFAGDYRGLPGILLAGQSARAGKLREALSYGVATKNERSKKADQIRIRMLL